MRRLLVASGLAAALAAVAGCTTGAQSSSAPDTAAIDNGRMVAERECSACHAVGAAGPSPRRDAPPFRSILTRYHSDTLEVELVQGIKLGHQDMPQFQLNPKAVNDLIVYIKSLR